MSNAISRDEKFIADAMLGKLARWMRTLGFDVEYQSDIDDNELVKRAIAEGRMILTRDTLLIKMRRVQGRYFFVESDSVADQLRQVFDKFRPDESLLLTRCLRCNVPLSDVPKTYVKDKVPPYVYETQERFVECPACGRIYWAGTHREEMLKEIEGMLKEDGGQKPH